MCVVHVHVCVQVSHPCMGIDQRRRVWYCSITLYLISLGLDLTARLAASKLQQSSATLDYRCVAIPSFLCGCLRFEFRSSCCVASAFTH